MSLATPDSTLHAASESSRSSEKVGILVIEPSASSPLGPGIVFANEAAARLSGYQLTSLIGSPLGLVYDHQDLPRLVRKLPIIAERDDFCWMDRNLHRNGGERIGFRWTIRPTQRSGKEIRHFTLTFSAIEEERTDFPIGAAAPERAAPVVAAASEAVPEGGAPVSGEAKSGRGRDGSKPARVGDTNSHHHHPEGDSPDGDDFEESRSESLALAAGGVAHDFKNALQTIKSNLEMANAVARSRDKLLTYLNDAQTALSDAEVLARQMLAFTKGEATTRCVFDVTECIERVSYLCTAGSRVRCRIRLAEDLRPIEGDPNRIYQVLHNLVINACQAMPNGGTLDLAAASTTIPEGETAFPVSSGSYTVISVKDRGCGIPPEALPHIFDKSYTTKQNGTGLGLASCRAIVKAHGGDIQPRSRLGVGTEFLIFLPSSSGALSNSEPKKKKPVPKPRRELADNGGGVRILVVEDQRGVSKATCGMLGHLGYESMIAETGEQAIHLYRRFLDAPERFDLVLLDMTLPGGLDGAEVFSELKRWDPEANVIATSGYFDEGPTQDLIQEGFTGVLAKPYSMDSLAITIDHALSDPV